MLALDHFSSFIKAHALFDHSSKILLAVSGGKDSVLMAHFFKTCGFAFGIAHCNFKLRGDESNLDEDFTRSLAEQLDAPFYTTSFNTKENAQSNHISIQMAARDLRYNWLEQIRKDNQYDVIALAHHKNDAVETILLNLVRGTGISGLHGILPIRGHLVRPMLFLKREEIDKLVIEENISYREDSSNLSVKYARNKIRLEIIPKLKELNPALEETFEANSKRFAELEEYFKQQMGNLRKELFREQPSGDYIIDLQRIKNLEPRGILLFELFHPFDFAENILDDLIASWDGEPGKIFESATHILLLDRGELILRYRHQKSVEDKLILEQDTLIKWGNNTFTCKRISAEDIQLDNNPNTAYVDAILLSFPLKLRSWKNGDSFYPLGMKGRKKLSDFFISKKIPRNYKQLVPILENGNGDILWIAGYQSDNRYKVTSQSEKVLIFEILK